MCDIDTEDSADEMEGGCVDHDRSMHPDYCTGMTDSLHHAFQSASKAYGTSDTRAHHILLSKIADVLGVSGM